jgi:Ca2+/H+ antiporter
MTAGEEATGRRGALVGASGLALAVCCVAAPAILGVAIGATLGMALDVGAAALVAVGIALFVHHRRTAKGKRC